MISFSGLPSIYFSDNTILNIGFQETQKIFTTLTGIVFVGVPLRYNIYFCKNENDVEPVYILLNVGHWRRKSARITSYRQPS